MQAMPQELGVFTKADGTVRLYHYSAIDIKGTLTVDPVKFGQSSFTSNDASRSTYPRSFYYLDPIRDKELIVPPMMYYGDYDATKIYDILEDPSGVKEATRQGASYNFDAMLRSIHQDLGFDGIYYYPNMHVVAMFVPFVVRPVESFDDDLFLVSRLTDYVTEMGAKGFEIPKSTMQWAIDREIIV